MHRKTALIALAATLVIGLSAAVHPTEARPAGKHFDHRMHATHQMRRPAGVHQHPHSRPHHSAHRGRRLVPGIAIGAGMGYVNRCAYEYRTWKATGSNYWRNRYFNCIH